MSSTAVDRATGQYVRLISIFQRRLADDPRAANSLWLMADKLLRMAAGLLVSVWVARYLGPQSFGQLSLAITLIAFSGFFSTLGMDPVVVKELATRTSDRGQVLGTVFVLRLVGGSLGYLCLLALVWWISPWDVTTHLLASIMGVSLILQAADTIDLWYQSQVQARFSVIAKGIAFLFAVAWRVAMILTEAPVEAFAWAMVIEYVCAAVLLALALARSGIAPGAWQVSRAHAEVILGASWPLLVSSFAVAVYMKADQFILSQLLDIKAAGIYIAAARISEAWYFVPASIIASVTPSLAAARTQSRELYEAQLFKLFRLLSWIAVLVAVPMSFMADWVIVALYGPQYAAAGPVLAIQIWAALFVCLGMAQVPWTINEGLTHLTMVRTWVGAGASIALSFLLIPWLGLVGAAIAGLCAKALSTILLNLLFKQTRLIFFMQLRAMALFTPLHAGSARP